LFALDVNDNARDLYQISGVTGSMPIPMPISSTSTSIEYEEGNGGMTYDSWENAASIDTGETKHIALLLSADDGSKTLKLYIGKKNVDATGNSNKINFLARNGLLYGRYYYLGGLEWEKNDRTGMWESTTPGVFVTSESDGWSESKFEDIDTNPNNPTQLVMAESNSGVYILDFDLKFESKNFKVMESSFAVTMITNFNQENSKYPDNVDWTKNNLIFV